MTERARKSEMASTTNIMNFNIDDEEEKKKASKVSFVKRMSKYLVLEPFIMCYVGAAVLPYQAAERLYQNKACRFLNENLTEDYCTSIIDRETVSNETEVILNDIQRTLIEITIWLQPMFSAVSAIMTVFLGAWSDRTGNRKTLLMLPVFLEIISSCGFIFSIYFVNLPLWAIKVIHSFPSSFSGFSVVFMGSYAYMADVIEPESRTIRMGVYGVLVVLTTSLVSLVSGPILTAGGPLGTYAVVLTFLGFSLVFAQFRVKDVRSEATEGKWFNKILQFFHPRNVWDTITLVTNSRGRQLASILLLVFGYLFYLGPETGGTDVFYDYVQKAIHMNYSDVGYLESVITVTSSLGTTIAITLFSKKLRLHDSILALIGVTSRAASRIYYGLVTKKLWYYFGVLVDIFGGLPALAVRSLATKVVEPEKVAKMCSLVSIVDAVVPVIYGPILKSIYHSTVATFPGAYMVASGIMVMPDFIIFGALYIMYRKLDRDTVINPAAKERHAHDNDVTVF